MCIILLHAKHLYTKHFVYFWDSLSRQKDSAGVDSHHCIYAISIYLSVSIYTMKRCAVYLNFMNSYILKALMGDAEKGRKTILNYFQVWEQFGATPEFFSLTKLLPIKGREGYPLRPGIHFIACK